MSEGLKKDGTLKKGYRYAKGGKVVKAKGKTSNRQTPVKGRTKRGLDVDAKKSAKPPGKRKTLTGSTYHERRANRSDKPKKRL